jgi:Putative restriction endonuclease
VLLVVEIADSSRGYDRGRKAVLYASFGVRELWVIDAVKRATRVFRKPSAEGYGETLDFGESDLLTPEFAPPEFALRLDELESLWLEGRRCGPWRKTAEWPRADKRRSQAVAIASGGVRAPKRRSRRRKSAITPARFAGVKSGHIASRNANSA